MLHIKICFQSVLLIACIIESNCKYNWTNCPTWNNSFSNACVIFLNFTSKFARLPIIVFKDCLFSDISTLVILIAEIYPYTAWAISSWLFANLLKLEYKVFKSDSVAIPNKKLRPLPITGISDLYIFVCIACVLCSFPPECVGH